ncbi:precorrin-3B synthase [Sulfitobacter undariae]|uniref:Precorrin-3B synthase n=1 Tax=Sulfitobacter undariae TaxID=1563671 RepID=A0A7W6E1P3_9RHOB|nr:cobalamin biosynthesis protein CobG [Sulfitobacter undariae]MBB3993096.1 precorrin-3B synthase [Sulfitobacter undariae]
MTAAPMVKGWCPGAYKPMMSVDGLVVRIRPRMARIEAEQATGLCEVALQYGSGHIDLTNRANLQIRGVAEADHEVVVARLGALGLLDADPEMEGRRNILVTPFWEGGDLAETLGLELLERLAELPRLPAKIGFAIDCADTGPLLTQDPADIRLEQGADGLILRAEDCPAGRAVTPETAIPALIEMAQWLADHITPDARRMSAVVANSPLPEEWTAVKASAPATRPVLGLSPFGALVAAPFGQIDAQALLACFATGVKGLRLTPWRALLLEGGQMPSGPAFIANPADPLLRVDACVGAPHCASAHAQTRILARQLAPLSKGRLHVSGCAKGCARSGTADVVLIAQGDTFSLVKDGRVSDTPVKTGLRPTDLLTGVF